MAENSSLPTTEQVLPEAVATETQFWAQFAVEAKSVGKGDDGDTYDTNDIGVTDYGSC